MENTLTTNSLAETHISPDDIPLVERDEDDDGTFSVTLCSLSKTTSYSVRVTLYFVVFTRAVLYAELWFFSLFSVAVKTARCRCKPGYVSKFTAASRGPPCNSTAFCWIKN